MHRPTRLPAAAPIRAPFFVLCAVLVIAPACSDDPVSSDPDQDASLLDTEDGRSEVDVPEPDTRPDDVDDDTTADADGSGDTTDTGPPPTCTDASECDDGLACTVDVCSDELGSCVWEIAADHCLIGARCWDAGTSPERDPCLVCDPDASAVEWSARDEGASCDPIDPCMAEATCVEGECVGSPIECADGNPCTVDQCDPVLGCVFPAAIDGIDCNDESFCTVDDACLAGVCTGDPVSCDDDNACTDDACDEIEGCVSIPNTDPCSDGDACTTGDTCAEGECVPGGPTNCEDGNLCTIDICDAGAGCAYLPNLNPCCNGTVSICDDGDPCTTDICTPEDGSCDYELNTAVCDDGSVCTTGDTCREGTCVGAESACNDGNPCTADFCNETTGCGATPISGGSCEDGLDCTFDESCVAGVCVPGVDECFCTPVFGRQAVKLTSMRIGSGGHPGEALDLDDNPATCAPTGNCSGGRHNALGAIGPFANESLADAVADGSLMLLFDVDDIALNPFRIALHQGELTAEDASCDHTTTVCDYLVSRSGLDPVTCEPRVTLTGTRSGSSVTAGGRGTVFPFDIPLGESVLTITLYDVSFEGQVTVSGGRITALQGVLGGAVPRSQLIDAIESLDPESLPVDPASLISLLNLLVKDDIDTDGNGTADAASIGIPLTAIGANIVGIE